MIDATCPLVTKVHTEAGRFARAGYRIILIGHARHEEVEGTFGEAPELARRAPVVFVVGSRNSSNSNRLVETATAAEASSYLIEDERSIDQPGWRTQTPLA